MAFAIMRAKKLNSMGSVAASLQHCYRDRDTPNADQARTADNEHHAAQSTDEAMGKLRDLLPDKRRKDAVLAVEYVMTASPEWWETATAAQQTDFFEQSKKWLAGKYGAENIVTASIHRDETSPHLSAFVVPMTADGRLSAKDYIGNRQKMTADQTKFAKAVEHLGLERGLERSRATHTSIKQHYAAIERGIASGVTISSETLEPKVLKKGIFTKEIESPGQVAERVTEAVKEAYQPMAANAAVSAQERRKAKEAQDTAKDLRSRLQPVLDVLTPLNQQNQAKLMVFMKAAGDKLLNQQKEEIKQKQVERHKLKPEKSHDRGGISR